MKKMKKSTNLVDKMLAMDSNEGHSTYSVLMTAAGYRQSKSEDVVKMVMDRILYQSLREDGLGMKTDLWRIDEIGPIVKGTAFYHEVDDHYPMIGCLLKVSTKYSFSDSARTVVGFYGVWKHNRSHKMAPFDFEDGGTSFDAIRFGNGYGDYFKLEEILVPRDELLYKLKGFDLSQYHYEE